MNEFATHCAYSSVPAGVAVTLLHLQLTVDPRETRQASTRIAALSCVHTGGAIHTGTVMGAEVQIWGGEERVRLQAAIYPGCVPKL